MEKEYRVELIVEGGCGTLLVGSSGIPLKRLESVLNQRSAEGWSLEFMVIEKKRFLLFWTREAVLITLSRARPAA